MFTAILDTCLFHFLYFFIKSLRNFEGLFDFFSGNACCLGRFFGLLAREIGGLSLLGLLAVEMKRPVS